MFITSASTRYPVRLLAAALLGGSSLLLIALSAPSPPPVYALAVVQAGLIRSPGAWVGRTVRVRAVAAMPCVTRMGGANRACTSWRLALLDASAPSTATALPLQGAPPPPLLAALRRLPLASWLVASPQQVRWGALSAYRVLLQAAPTAVCDAPPCYEALLLDAAPGSMYP